MADNIPEAIQIVDAKRRERATVSVAPPKSALSISKAVNRESIDSLTGLRFIAALSVLVGHAAAGVMVFDPPANFVRYFTQGSAIGMPLFFVLSGFVIHYNYGNSFRSGFVEPTVDFFIARFARLYPLYIFALLLFIFNQRMLAGILTLQYDLSVFPRYLLLWQAWSIEYRGTTWFGHLLLPPAWSISVEVFFYAIYPLLALHILRLGTAARAGQAFAVVVIFYCVAIGFCFRYFDELRVWGNDAFQINADPQNALLGWLLNTGPVGRLLEFIMGALAAQAYLVLRDRPPSVQENRLGSFVLYLGIFLAAAFYLGMQHNKFLGFAGSYPGGLSPLFALIIFCCARYYNPVRRMLGTPRMVTLGDASYSIYLLHFFTLQLFHLLVGHPLTPHTVVLWVLQMLAAIVFTIILSVGTFRVIEVPSRAYLRSTLTRLKQRTVWRWLPHKVPLATKQSVLILVCVAGSFALWNWPKQSLIDVIDATYGSNCRDFTPPQPYANVFRPSNATAAVRQACVGKAKCDYTVNINVIGDPAPRCPKDFSVKYRCPSDIEPRTSAVEAEAHGKIVTLDCSDTRLSASAHR